jgi:hypothetical protein
MADETKRPRRNDANVPVGDEQITDEERVTKRQDRVPDDPVDEATDESFPASDPPSFTPSRAGTPARRPADEE